MSKAVHILAAALLAIAFDAAARPARAQSDYPSRTIRIIVPISPGATADTLPRILAEKLMAKWGQPVIVENRTGAALNIGAEAVARALPDGYTLLATPPSPLTVNQSLYPKLAFDPSAFVPVTVIGELPNVLVVHPKASLSSLQALIAFAKANPNKLSYASAGIGGTPHLSMELLKTLAGIQVLQVPYRGLAPALVDLLAGNVDMMFDNLGNVLAPVANGQLKALGVGSEKRIPALPDVPAISEMFPGFLSTTWFAIVAPPRTPPEIAEKLSSAIAEIVRQPDVAAKFEALSTTPVGSSPAATAALINEETQRWRKVIVAAGIKPQ